jgi:hypothetical protein
VWILECDEDEDGGVQMRAEVVINISVIIPRRNSKITPGHKRNRGKVAKESKEMVGVDEATWVLASILGSFLADHQPAICSAR